VKLHLQFQKYGRQMILQERITLLALLGDFIRDNNPEWQAVKEHAYRENPWFIPEFIETAAANMANCFLKKELLAAWATHYSIPEDTLDPKSVGIVMAGNITLCVYERPPSGN
jgi:hypothetical protein